MWIFINRYSQAFSRFMVPVLCVENTLKVRRAAAVTYYSGSELASTVLCTKEHRACGNCQINSIKKFGEKF
jgi:hypothetical protein